MREGINARKRRECNAIYDAVYWQDVDQLLIIRFQRNHTELIHALHRIPTHAKQ